MAADTPVSTSGDVLEEYGIRASMSRRGKCWDNACSETQPGSLEVERMQGQRFWMQRQAKDEAVARLLSFSQMRLHAGLCQSDEVRARLVYGSGQARQFVTWLWDADSKGKVSSTSVSLDLHSL